MELPVPTPDQIETFRLLHERQFGVRLSQAEATDVATRFLQLYFILRNAFH
jgi:hypothetical protein